LNYKQAFIKFLKENHAFEEWKLKVCNQHLDEGIGCIDRTLNYIDNNVNAIQALDNGIIFYYKHSGHQAFWNNLNMKWKEHLKCITK